jgi:tRNA U34 2-thiouridine synthase MnmA/TrmU
VLAAVRYRMRPVPAHARLVGDELRIEFQQTLYGVAPGQSVVCYREDVVIGGGVIACAS